MNTELSPMQAATRLGVSEGTLRNWRNSTPRLGPKPTYKGKRGRGKKPRVVYLETDVAAWEQAIRSES
jgi:transposase